MRKRGHKKLCTSHPLSINHLFMRRNLSDTPQIIFQCENNTPSIQWIIVFNDSIMYGLNEKLLYLQGLELKGQMVYCPESDSLLFIGSPFLDGLDGLTGRGLFISDIPLHDATRDVILVGEQARAQVSKIPIIHIENGRRDAEISIFRQRFGIVQKPGTLLTKHIPMAFKPFSKHVAPNNGRMFAGSTISGIFAPASFQILQLFILYINKRGCIAKNCFFSDFEGPSAIFIRRAADT